MPGSQHVDSLIEIALGVAFTWMGFRPSAKRPTPTTTKIFRICGPGLIVVGATLLFLKANAVMTWTRTFTSDNVASAEFPGKPGVQESTDTAAGIVVKRTSLTMTIPGRDIALFLSFSPLPQDARGATDAQRVAGILEYLGTQGATVVDQATDPTGVIHRVTFKQSDKKVTTRMAVAYVGDTLYRVVAAWADADEDLPLTDRFVTSFRLSEAPR